MMNAPDAILLPTPQDMPKVPPLRLILKHSQGRDRGPLTGFRRGWLLMIRRQCAWAVQLWPVAQVWTSTDGMGWQRSIAREQSLVWLGVLRHSRTPIEQIERQADDLWVEKESPQLVLPSFLRQARRYWWNRHHGWKLIGAIPPAVFQLFTNTGNENGMGLLKFFQLRPEAIELFEANRGIGYLLAYARQFRRGLGPAEVEAMVCWPQRKILRALGFPDTELMRQVMRKMEPTHQETRVLKAVRRLFHCRATAALLQHTHFIHLEVILWLDASNHRELYTPRLIAEYAEIDDDTRWEIKCLDGFQLLAEAAQTGLWKRRPIISLRHLKKQVAKVRVSIGSVAAPLPAPPTEGDLGLIPLRTGPQIIEEGRAMKHCLGFSYQLLNALHGRSYFYQVLTPKRGTLEVRRVDTGFWEQGEFEWANRQLPTGEEVWAMDHRLRELIGPGYQFRPECQRELPDCHAEHYAPAIPAEEHAPADNSQAA
jgi:hypothetical protein